MVTKTLAAAKILFILVPWIVVLILFGRWASQIIRCPQFYDVSRRVTSPAYDRTAVLVRAVDFDQNFRLYIVNHGIRSISCDPRRALWISSDFNPDTSINLHEDLEWSLDSTIIAVIIDGSYRYAHDFDTGEQLQDPVAIQSLLQSHNSIK